MPAKMVRSEYDKLQNIAGMWHKEEEEVNKSLHKLKGLVDQLDSGKDWIGEGATAFYQEMNGEVFPALNRLKNAMGHAAEKTNRISKHYKTVEDTMAQIWKAIQLLQQ